MESVPAYKGPRDGCLAALRGGTEHYTYILRRADGRPFYVGKGIRSRVFDHENEARHPNDRKSNSHKLNVIRAMWQAGEAVTYEIDGFFPTELLAYSREELLISRFKRLHEGGPLTNRHPGGGSESGASPFSKAKHTATLAGIPEDDPETACLNWFVLGIGTMRSVVLKPMSRFRVKHTIVYPTKSIGPSVRQAIALAATASASGIVLLGAVRLPRKVCVDGVRAFVENGVSCDIASSGMGGIESAEDPADEMFVLNAGQSRAVIGMIGMMKAKDLGIANLAVTQGLTV